MRRQLLNIVIISIALIGSMFLVVTHARTKCWVNNEEVTECGDSIPPEYTQKGHRELDKTGLTRRETKRAKTIEELKEETRIAKIEAEKKKKEEAQKNKDRILLKTFSSVKDIERARDERIAILESTIKHRQILNKKTQGYLNKRILLVDAQEKEGKTPSLEIMDEIKSLEQQIEKNNEFIAKKQKEQEDIRASHAADIERFKKLKK